MMVLMARESCPSAQWISDMAQFLVGTDHTS